MQLRHFLETMAKECPHFAQVSITQKAIRLDGQGDTGLQAQLGMKSQCNCCDYLLPNKDEVFLIELSDLIKQLIDLQAKNKKAPKDQKECLQDEVDKLRQEMKLKIFGSLIVLFKIPTKFQITHQEVHQKKITAIFVVCSQESNLEHSLVFEKLAIDIGCMFSKTLISEVKILDIQEFKKKLLKIRSQQQQSSSLKLNGGCMPIITLPDGSQRSFEHSVTIADVAASIGAGLAKAALAGTLNGRLCDTSTVITTDSTLSIVTEKDAEGIEIIRHSCAHLMAQAVKSLYPETQVTIGPMIEDGFYYDFARKAPFTTDDLAKIEAKMTDLAKQDIPVSRSLLPRDQAVDFFTQLGEKYKAEIIASIPSNEDLSLYQQAEFTDLCRGPHVPSTGKIKAFKLMKVAGAYWRGDAKNEMLQRIYGTAWANKKDLEAYLHRLEEAEKRDHRKLGKHLNLFHLQQEAPGMVFWHDRGWTVYVQIQNYIRNLLRQHGYQEVHTPQIVDRSLWEKSGHWDKFREEMFTTNSEERDYAVKPMNCPCHIQIYNQGLKSYRDLPLRLAEFGSCHRNEPSGALHGLMRLRNFVQDDAHIFCTEDQIQAEVSQFIDLLFKVYADFGFHDVAIKLSTRPEKRVGSDEIWDKAEKSLELALNHKNLAWQLQPGEGAFYGPKIEFSLKDSIGRVWQCGTIQVDFSMPARLGAEYVAADNSKQVPVMLHRAILGSLERFIGILIENHAGALPVWLSPIQVVVLNITDKFAEYAESVVKKLQTAGIRADIDLRNEKVNFKIREHTLQKVPYLLIVGQKEQESQQVAVRSRKGEDFGAMDLDAFLAKLNAEVDSYQ